jgi:hypothetical protein
MELFYNTVVIVAVVLLILILTYIGIMLAENKLSGENQSSFPPVKNSCPDNWDAKIKEDASGVEKTYCLVPNAGMKNIGTILDTSTENNDKNNAEITVGYDSSSFSDENNTVGVIDFDSPLWLSQGKTADCAKKTWADTYDIQWDGISNYNQCE